MPRTTVANSARLLMVASLRKEVRPRAQILSGVILFGVLIYGAGGCTKKNDPLHVDEHFTFPQGVPPDPGGAGKTTLDGIDIDRDGLRDDVQRWIYARYPNDELKRKALRQMALGFQGDMKAPTTREETRAAAKRASQAIECLGQRFPKEREPKTGDMIFHATIEMEYVRARVLNTKARTEQYFKTDARFDGMVFDGPSEDEKRRACDP